MDPQAIEEESMKIILSELKERGLLDLIPDEQRHVVTRVIHSTADFDFASSLVFSEDVMSAAYKMLKSSPVFITDTNMIASGINKAALSKVSGTVRCYMSDPDVAEEALSRSETRAAVSMERAARETPNAAFVIGNAPTALLRLCRLVEEGTASPSLVVGVPVGFVNVIESKEALMSLAGVPRVVSTGPKGGSTVAVAIVNAILYGWLGRER
ncbi:MAG: precorrin-8X methylmutase [Synergistaceae bacterium]|jgi:precorrin-8X/cobalt-precorrin-8 methylmutase|nr:precorrin-8X methylmutase [Synergistaceae bacterium]